MFIASLLSVLVLFNRVYQVTAIINSSCFYKCKNNEGVGNISMSSLCVTRGQVCDLSDDCPDGSDETYNCEKLPLGSYCSFEGNFIESCGWRNEHSDFEVNPLNPAPSSGYKADENPKWIKYRNQSSGEVYATVNFSETHSFNTFSSHAAMRSPDFAAIPFYHSIVDSPLFQSCLIQFTYWNNIPYGALSIRFVPLTSQNKRKKEGIEIFHKLSKSNEKATWTKISRPLPLNQSSSYFLRFEVNGGIGRGLGHKIRVTNITLSKECFGIDVSRDEPRSWPDHLVEGDDNSFSWFSIEGITILLCLLILFGLAAFSIILFNSKLRKRLVSSRSSCGGQTLLTATTGGSSSHAALSQSSTDVQLSRLRAGHNPLTEYNPNYEFGGSTSTLQDLKEIPREKLTLIKALGRGAFGEVYQGYLRNMPGEIIDELPVALKTLPVDSANNQEEMDFLIEALIMSKFKHR